MNAKGWKLPLALCASLAIVGVSAPVGSARERVKPKVQRIGLLFTQTAEHGSLHRVSGGGHYTHVLELSGASRQVVWFSDRPARQAGQIPVRGFFSSWKGFGFQKDPPNAALTLLDAADHEDTIVVELGRGRFIRRGSRVRYPARIVTQARGNLGHFEHARDPRVARHFGRASLFIDDAYSPVVNGCVIERWTSCTDADLSNADLSGADLYHADFSGANLSNADLSNAYLYNSDFSSADLSGAQLGGADFSWSNLAGANLYGTLYAGQTNFCGVVMPDGGVEPPC